MNLSDMRTKLRRQIGNPTVSDVSDNDLTDVINEAYQHILDRYRQDHAKVFFQFTTENGTGLYALPGHIGRVFFVWDLATRRRLKRLSDADVAEFEDTTYSARPRGWTRVGHMISLYPSPDGAYAFGAMGKVVSSPLSADTDEPMLDATWHDGVLARARYEWWDHYRRDNTKSREALVSWNEWISSKPALADEELRPMQVEVPPLDTSLRDPNWVPRHVSSNVWGFDP
jgi:hypothetical protein